MASSLGTLPSTTDKAPPQSSAKTHIAAGSGSRPGNVRSPIETSAPMNNHTLDRDPPAGALGMGKTKQQGT